MSDRTKLEAALNRFWAAATTEDQMAGRFGEDDDAFDEAGSELATARRAIVDLVRENVAIAFALGNTCGGWSDANELIARGVQPCEDDDYEIADALLNQKAEE